MCPACMAATAMLIASAVSTGGVAAVMVSKLLAPEGEKSLASCPKGKNQKEEAWEQQPTSK